MKKLILLALITCTFAACQKAGTAPQKPIVINKDTIPDKARFNVQLVKDSVYSDEIAIVFNHTYHTSFVAANSEDAIVPGAGPIVSLFALSSDGRDLIVDGVPYKAGMSIALDVFVGKSGPYFLRANRRSNIPSSIHIWCRDNYLKDSLDMQGGNYHFNIDKADANSYGKKRFEILIKGQ
jgi:hypothetical protein